MVKGEILNYSEESFKISPNKVFLLLLRDQKLNDPYTIFDIIFGDIIEHTLHTFGKEISNRESQIDHSHTEKQAPNQTEVKCEEEKAKKPKTMPHENM